MSPRKNKVSHKLEAVALRELGVVLSKEEQTADWGGAFTPEMIEYAARDAEVLLPLVEALAARTKEANLGRVSDIESRALPAVAWMAGAGVPFDAEG